MLIGAFQGKTGGYTLDNVRLLFHHPYIDAYKTSIEMSLVTAVDRRRRRALRSPTRRFARARRSGSASMLTTFSGVAANFGGIPLAFAFIATLGPLGIVTQFLQNQLHFDLTAHGFSLFTKTGVELAYLYFQLPLMILVIAPAIDGLRKEWREASSNLGASAAAVLALRRPARADAVDARRDHPALRQRVRGVRHGVQPHVGHGQPRADPDRRVLQRQRARQPAPRAGAGVRDVRRARAR